MLIAFICGVIITLLVAVIVIAAYAFDVDNWY